MYDEKIHHSYNDLIVSDIMPNSKRPHSAQPATDSKANSGTGEISEETPTKKEQKGGPK